MRSIRTRVRTLAALALATGVLAACGKDAVGPESSLSRDQAYSLAMALLSDGGFGGGALLSSAPNGPHFSLAPSAPRFDVYSDTLDDVSTCAGGGDVLVHSVYSEDVDTTTWSGTVDMTARLTHRACVVSTGQDDFVVDGNPNLDLALHMDVANDSLTAMSFTYRGGVSWSGSGDSGDCSMDLSFTASMAQQTGRLKGSFCGYSFDQTVSDAGYY